MTDVGFAILIGLLLLAFKNRDKPPAEFYPKPSKKSKYIFLTVYTILAVIGFVWVLAKLFELLLVVVLVGIPIGLYILSRKERKLDVHTES